MYTYYANMYYIENFRLNNINFVTFKQKPGLNAGALEGKQIVFNMWKLSLYLDFYGDVFNLLLCCRNVSKLYSNFLWTFH